DSFQLHVLNEELARSDSPQLDADLQGIDRVGPLIINHGSDEQKRAILPAILKGEVRWCELFSEPGAGSDLASLQTRAARDGEENRGWYYVMSHMDSARASYSEGFALERTIATLVELAQAAHGRPLPAAVRSAVADRVVEAAVMRSLWDYVATEQKRERVPPY